MSNSRTQNAIYNSTVSMALQIFKIIISFANRTVFIYFLGITYLGINGLFTSILSMLSLAELGMSTAIAVSLYKPLAQKDFSKVQAYMQLFKKIYKLVALIVLFLGLVVSVFLSYFLNDIELTGELYLIYILFLINTVVSYLFTYKRTLLDADQKRYINVATDFFVFLIGSILQWGVLYVTKSYIIFLVITIAITIISNIIISYKVNKIYYQFKDISIGEIKEKEKKEFLKNIKGTVISKIAETIVFSTDNILMSAFISVDTVGIYANYSMIVKNIQGIIAQLVSSLSGSVGNLINTESKNDRAMDVLKKYQFIVFIVSFFSAIGILLFSNILISLWLGEKYLFSIEVVFVITLSFFITNYRIPFLTFINSYGLFWEQRIKNIVEAILNLVFSLALLIFTDLGILAVLIGTVLSSILTVFWYEPYSVYKFGLKLSPVQAINRIVIHYTYMLSILLLVYYLMTKVLLGKSLLILILYSIIIYIIIVVVTLCIFSKTEEFKYLINMIRKTINRTR